MGIRPCHFRRRSAAHQTLNRAFLGAFQSHIIFAGGILRSVLMSFSDDYKAGYTGNFGPDVDPLSYSFNMGQNDRDRAIREGSYGGGGGGAFAGLGGAGPVVVAVVVIMAIVGFLLAWITYPIAGILTGIVFALAGFVLQNHGVNGVGQIFTLCVPCYIV